MRRTFLFILSLVLIQRSWAFAQDRWIYAVGGGDRPQEGFKRATSKVQKKSVKALIIAYASRKPQDYVDSFSKELNAVGVREIHSLFGTLDNEREIQEAVEMILSADLICLTGGSQMRAMQALGLQAVQDALTLRYHAGVPFITTSAGTALLTATMLTGEGSGIDPGLGLLDGFVMEQHFVARYQDHDGKEGREKRVERLMRESATIDRVVAIDEDALLEIKNEEFAEVIGPQQVVIFEKAPGAVVYRYSLWAGDKLNLKTWLPELTSVGASCSRALSGPLLRKAVEE